MNKYFGVAGMAVVVGCSGSALAQFGSATISAYVTANAVLYDAVYGDSQFGGGEYSNFFNGLAVSNGATVQHPDEISFASGNASQNTQFTETEIISNAQVSSDVDYYGDSLTKGFASGSSSLSVTFTIEQAMAWSFKDGNVNGTHGGGSVALYQGDSQVFYFDSIGMPGFAGESGTIGPGQYTFYADIYAGTNANDGFGGLFADASYNFHFVLSADVPPPPCPGDADGNGEVNFADITNVLTNFGMFYKPGTGPGDADHNGIVNFADITAVLSQFNAVCP